MNQFQSMLMNGLGPNQGGFNMMSKQANMPVDQFKRQQMGAQSPSQSSSVSNAASYLGMTDRKNGYIPKERDFDVLKAYEDLEKMDKQSILTGNLDSGIDLGKFYIDTSNNLGQNNSSEIIADRFVGPYARTQLNSPSWLTSRDGDEDPQAKMQNYF